MDYVQLSSDKLEVNDIISKVSSPKCGATSVFIGTTRDSFEGRTVSKLEYEAYETMAIKSMHVVCKMIREKFDIENVAVYHRLGDVPIEETSVVIAVSAPHRAPAMEAVSNAIDLLKANVPIWKKEVYVGSEPAQWKSNSELSCNSANQINEAKQDSLKRSYSDTESEDDNEVPVPPHLIQIQADAKEIDRRIEAFIALKRSKANDLNIHHFCVGRTVADSLPDESTCARVCSTYTKRKTLQSVVRVHRVQNELNPECHNEDLRSNTTLPGIEPRLVTVERHLQMSVSARMDVLARLKAVEEKLMFLESLSPEYIHGNSSGIPKPIAKKPLSDTDLDEKMRQLEGKLTTNSWAGGKTTPNHFPA